MNNTVLAIFYSLISTLPIIFLIPNPIITFLSIISLFVIITPIFRSYIKSNINEFEYRETTLPTVLIIFIYIISLVLPIIIDRSPLALVRSIPIFLSLYLLFLITVNDFTNKTIDPITFKVRYIHTKLILNIVIVFIFLKFFLLLIFVLYKLDSGPNTLWIISFLSDFLLLINRRREINIMGIFQEGFHDIFNKNHNNRVIYIIFFIPILFALLISRNFSILPYYVILEFLRGLFKERVIPDINIEIPEEEAHVPENSMQDFFLDEAMGDYKISPLWAKLWEILTYFIMVVAAFILIYILLFPILSPLFNKKHKKITFKEYYKDLISKLIAFFRSIFINKVTRSIYKQNNVIKDIKNNHKGRTIVKIKEVNRLLNYYTKLVKWFYKKNGYKRLNITVDDFFNLVYKDYNSESIFKLNGYFNIGFYSEEILGEEKMNEIKTIFSDLIKNRVS